MGTHGYPAGYMQYGDSASVDGSEIEMKRYPSQHSMAGTSYVSGSRSYSYVSGVSGSRKSLFSTHTTYTPSQFSYVLPIVANAPNPEKKPKDHFGLAFCTLFINPIFGLIALLLSEQSKIYYNRCNYKKAATYGSYARGMATGGIFSMICLIMLIIALVCWHNYRYDY